MDRRGVGSWAAIAAIVGAAEVAAAAPLEAVDFGGSLVRPTNLADGAIEVAGPLPAVRWGLAPELTLGLETWPTMFTLGGGGVGAAVSIDYQRDVGGWRLGTGVWGVLGGGGKVGLRWLVAHASAERALTKRQSITVAALAGGIGFSGTVDVPADAYSGNHFEGAVVAVTYAAAPARWFGLELTAGTSPLARGESVSTGGRMSLTGIVAPQHGAFGRIGLHARFGSRWRLSLSALVSPAIVAVTPLWPNLSLSRRW